MGSAIHAPLFIDPAEADAANLAMDDAHAPCAPRAPRAGDGVERWFEALMAERLTQAGLPTLAALARRINEAGARWWYPVRGLGATKAVRVADWLRQHQASTGLVIAVRTTGRGERPENAPSTTPSADFAWLSPSTTPRSPSSFTA